MKSGENRIQHVLEHLEPNPFKKTHTVFNCQKNEVLSLVDEAWTATEKVLLERAPNGYDIYSVDMNRVIGTQNETIIKIITKSGSSEIVTAYPVK